MNNKHKRGLPLRVGASLRYNPYCSAVYNNNTIDCKFNEGLSNDETITLLSLTG